MVKIDLQEKYLQPVKDAINKQNNPYNNQPIKQVLTPMPKPDFVPLNNLVKSIPDQGKYLTEVGINATRATIRGLQNIPNAIDYSSNKKLKQPTSVNVGFSDVGLKEVETYQPVGTPDLDSYKSVKESMDSKYQYSGMNDNIKQSYKVVVDEIIRQESENKTFEEQRALIQSMYQDKEMPDFVQEKLAKIDSKETEYTLKIENARQKLVEMSEINLKEQLDLEKRYEDKPISDVTKYAGKVLGTIVQMSPYIATSAVGGWAGGALFGAGGGTAFSYLLGTGTMYGQSYTNSMAKAISEGATQDEATQYAHISAMIEAGTEALSGGIPLAPKGLLSSGVQGMIDSAVKRKITDGAVRKLFATAVDVFGEGAEEALAEYLGSMALAIYREDERTDEELSQDMIDSFIMGAITSGTMQMTKYATLKMAEKFVAEKTRDISSISVEEAEKTMNDFVKRARVNQQDGQAYEIKDMPRSVNGYYDPKTNKIVLNAKDVEENGLIASALPHEMVHAIEKYKGYDELANFVLAYKQETLGMALDEIRQTYQEKYDQEHQAQLDAGNTSHTREIATTDKMVREFVAEFIKENIASRPVIDVNGQLKVDSNGNIVTYRNYDALLRLASNKPKAIENIKKVIRKWIRNGKISDALQYDENAKATALQTQEYLETLDEYLNKVLENADKGLFGDYAVSDDIQYSKTENNSDKYVGMSKEKLWDEHYRVLDEMNAIKGSFFSKENIEARKPFNEELARISFAMQGKNYDDMFNSYDEYIEYSSNEREKAIQEYDIREQQRKQKEIDRINSLVKMDKKDVLMSDEDIESFIEENELDTTNDINQAIFIFGNGTMIDGGFEGGIRGVDHQILSSLFEYTTNYPKIEGVSLWGNIHLQTGVVRIVPEENVALIMQGQELTNEQQSILDESGYKVEEYLPLVQDKILVDKRIKQYSLNRKILSSDREDMPDLINSYAVFSGKELDPTKLSKKDAQSLLKYANENGFNYEEVTYLENNKLATTTAEKHLKDVNFDVLDTIRIHDGKNIVKALDYLNIDKIEEMLLFSKKGQSYLSIASDIMKDIDISSVGRLNKEQREALMDYVNLVSNYSMKEHPYDPFGMKYILTKYQKNFAKNSKVKRLGKDIIVSRFGYKQNGLFVFKKTFFENVLENKSNKFIVNIENPMPEDFDLKSFEKGTSEDIDFLSDISEYLDDYSTPLEALENLYDEVLPSTFNRYIETLQRVTGYDGIIEYNKIIPFNENQFISVLKYNSEGEETKAIFNGIENEIQSAYIKLNPNNTYSIIFNDRNGFAFSKSHTLTIEELSEQFGSDVAETIFNRIKEDKYTVVERDSLGFSRPILRSSSIKEIQNKVDKDKVKNILQRIRYAYGQANPNETFEKWLSDLDTEYLVNMLRKNNNISTKFIDSPFSDISDFDMVAVIDAYKEGLLKNTPYTWRAIKKIDLSEQGTLKFNEIYSPRNISNIQKAFKIANSESELDELVVNQARASALIQTQNRKTVEFLGLGEETYNKLAQDWATYSEGAYLLSKKLNEGVAEKNRWTGLENTSVIYNNYVKEEDLKNVFGYLKGGSKPFEVSYLAGTVMALDTHIDYSDLSISFNGDNDYLRKNPSVLGYFDRNTIEIVIKKSSLNTVAHEIGHYIDFQWARELGIKDSTLLSNPKRANFTPANKEVEKFIQNFDLFMEDITDSGSIKSDYLQEYEETFARFVALFVKWTNKNSNPDNKMFDDNSYMYDMVGDRFSDRQYRAFVKILQQKAKLDTFGYGSEIGIRPDNKGNYPNKKQNKAIKGSVVRDEFENIKVMYMPKGKAISFEQTRGVIDFDNLYKTTSVDGVDSNSSYLNIENPVSTERNTLSEGQKIADFILEADYRSRGKLMEKSPNSESVNEFIDKYRALNNDFEIVYKIIRDGKLNAQDAIDLMIDYLGFDGFEIWNDQTQELEYMPFLSSSVYDINNPTPEETVQYSLKLDKDKENTKLKAISDFGTTTNIREGKYITVDGQIIKGGELDTDSIKLNTEINQAIVYERPNEKQLELLRKYYDNAIAGTETKLYLTLHKEDGQVEHKVYPIVYDMNQIIKDVQDFYKENSNLVLDETIKSIMQDKNTYVDTLLQNREVTSWAMNFDFDSDTIEQDLRRLWIEANIEKGLNSVKDINLDRAERDLYEVLPQSYYDGWLREANSGYKPKIVQSVLGSEKGLNATLNIMRDVYNQENETNLSMDEFLNQYITLYRGNKKGAKRVDQDYFVAYSMDEKIAKSFAGQNGTVDSITVKPSETFGMLRTVGELEVLVPSYVEKEKLGDNFKYSLEIDSKYRQLSAIQKDFFKDTKAINENGQLQVVYHGTTGGDFTIFDRNFGNTEGDFGKGFYFTNNEYDVSENYASENGADLTSKIEKMAIELEYEKEYENLSEEERIEIAKSKFIKGEERTIEAYLNIKNPAYVGGNNETWLFNPDDYYDRSDFENEDEFYEEVNAIIGSTIDEIVYKVESQGINTYGLSELLYEVSADGTFISRLKEKINELYLEDEKGNMAGNEVVRIILEELGYDGIIDSSVPTKFKNMAYMDTNTIHYIVFKPEQIKNVDNLIPSISPDIRYSLSADQQKTATRRYQGTALKAIENQQIKETVEERIKNGTFEYYVVADKDSVEKAINRIGDDVDKSYNEFVSLMDSGVRLNKDQLVFGQLVLKKLEKSGDTEKVMRLIQDIAVLGTELGQQVQALSLIRRMTPTGQLITLQRTLNRMKARYNDEGNPIKITIPTEYQEFFIEAQNRYDELNVQKVDLENKLSEIAELEEQVKNLTSQLDPNVQEQLNSLSSQVEALQRAKAEQNRLEIKLERLENLLENYSNVNSMNLALNNRFKAIAGEIKETQALILENKKLLTQLNKLNEKYDSLVDHIEGVDKQALIELNDKIKIAKKAQMQLDRLIKQNAEYTSQKNIDEVMAELSVKIAEQLPVTWKDKLNNYRYLSMLGNIKTHLRNVMGNGAVLPMTFFRDVFSVAIQQFLPEDQRTKVLIASREAVQFAKMDYMENASLIKGDNKYDMKSKIEQDRKIYETRWLEAIRKGNFDLLEWEDDLFVKMHYVAQLSKYITAKKWDVNNISEENLNEARIYATLQARKATFKQTSETAKALNRLAKNNPYAGWMIEATLPFKKTPINIMKMGTEYSPIGLTTTIVKGAIDVKNGKFSADEFIEHLSAGLSGTGIALLGGLVYSMGILEISDDDDESKRLYNFQNAIGRQRYSIRWGNDSFSIDWLAPAVMPFIIGAEIRKMSMDNEESSWLDNSFEALINIFNPVFELTMLQGVLGTFQSFSGSGVAMAGEALTTMGSNLLSQFFPTLLGQIARTVDPYARSTNPDAQGSFSGTLEKTARQLANKVPYVSMINAPIVNVKGEYVSSSENIFMRAFLNLISPATYKKGNVTANDEEILRLYELTKDTDVLPKTASKYFKNDGIQYDLGNQEYSDYANDLGDISYSMLDKLIGSHHYDSLDDESKIKALSKIYDYAQDKAKDNILKKKGLSNVDKAYVKIESAENYGIKPLDYLIAKLAFDNMSGEDKKEKFIKYLQSNGFDVNTYLELVGGYKKTDTSSSKTIKGLKKLK